jgi:hypothetical protein
MVGTILLLLSLLAAQDKPVPKFPVGKETTYVTGPLDGEGYIDYEAALNDLLGKGVTPEKNANALLWKAFGPRPEGGKGMPAEFFRRLGIEEPPDRGDYFIGLSKYMREHLKLDRDQMWAQFETTIDQQSRTGRWPWVAKDYPLIAGWLKVNEKPLDLAVEAAKRPDYYNPLVSHRREPGSLGPATSSMSVYRELAGALTARAMLRMGEGQFDEAWQDLLACHRLGRLVACGATFIEALFGIAIESVASNAGLAYLERAGLTVQQAQNRLKDLQGLPPLPLIADKVDLGERLEYLDMLQYLRRNGGISMLEFRRTLKPDPKELEALAKIDWEPVLRIL